MTVFSLNANTYPVGSLLTNSNFPDSQKASKNDFHGLLGQALPLSSCVSLARPVLSGALHFQASDTQAIVITAIILIIVLITNLLIFFLFFLFGFNSTDTGVSFTCYSWSSLNYPNSVSVDYAFKHRASHYHFNGSLRIIARRSSLHRRH